MIFISHCAADSIHYGGTSKSDIFIEYFITTFIKDAEIENVNILLIRETREGQIPGKVTPS